MRKDLITAVSALALLAGPALAQDPTVTSRPFDTGVVEQYRTTPVVGNLMAEDILGMEVFGAGGEEIGNVEDIVVDPQTGQPSRLIVAYGGFLGLGERRIAVGWNEIQPMPGEDGIMLTGVTEEMLEGYEPYEAAETDLTYRGMVATDTAATEPVLVQPEDITATAGTATVVEPETDVQAVQAAETAAAAGVTPIEGAEEQAQLLGALRADQIIGMEVFGAAGEEVGNVQDFLMDPQSGQPTHLIVAYGGFLGLGEQQIAVEWNQIQPMPGEEQGIMLTGITGEMLDELEAYEPAEGAVTYRGLNPEAGVVGQEIGEAAGEIEAAGEAAVGEVAETGQQVATEVGAAGEALETEVTEGGANVVVVEPQEPQVQPPNQATEAIAAQPAQQEAVVVDAPMGFDPDAAVLGQMRADQIMGAEVFGAGGEEIGNVADIIVDPQSGQMSHLIVSAGGFLGLGERRFAVEWANVQPMPNEDGVMLTNVTAADVEAMEEYEEAEGTLAYSRFPEDVRRPVGTAPGALATGEQATVQVVTPEQQAQVQTQQQADVQVVTPEQQAQDQQQQAQAGEQQAQPAGQEGQANVIIVTPQDQQAAQQPQDQQQQAQTGQAAAGDQMVGLSFEDIMGREVVGADGEVIGQVSDVLLNEQGQATDVVISAGGVLGLGDKEVAVPLQDMALIEGQDRLQATNLTSANVEEMEAFEYGEATLSYERRSQ